MQVAIDAAIGRLPVAGVMSIDALKGQPFSSGLSHTWRRLLTEEFFKAFLALLLNQHQSTSLIDQPTIEPTNVIDRDQRQYIKIIIIKLKKNVIGTEDVSILFASWLYDAFI